MQGKVSMVTPCYNKVDCVGDMLDSVLSQKWNNIELILVNDGSTDGTRDVIAAYMPKFRKRGFDVVIVDQENAGVARAVYNGILRASGKYICFPDCDDALKPEYVSAMAEVLEDNPNEVWVVCDSDNRFWNKDESFYHKSDSNSGLYKYKLFESYLTLRFSYSVWLNMVRTDYLLDNIKCYSFSCSQEQGIITALCNGGKRPIHINKSLYRYNTQIGESIMGGLEKCIDIIRFFEGYKAGYAQAIDKSDFVTEEKERYRACLGVGVGVGVWQYSYAVKNDTKDNIVALRTATVAQIAEIVRTNFSDYIDADKEKIIVSSVEVFHRAFSNRIIGYQMDEWIKKYKPNSKGRVIAYGFGTIARRILPSLCRTELKPDFIWDRAVSMGDSYMGIALQPPNISEINSQDTVVVLIHEKKAAAAVYDLLGGEERDNVLYYYDLLDWLAEWYYPSKRKERDDLNA